MKNSFNLNGKDILITGGTGSLGKALVKEILSKWPKVNKLIIFSRDEQKQYNMANDYPSNLFPNIRFFIGDVRDEQRLSRACENVNYIIHAAAMKHVPIAEYNPDECIKTNIIGAQNVINAAIHNNVDNVVALSTDKACAPTNLYGASKLASDKLFIAANNIKGKRSLRFSVVRYGNVMGSNGSVIPFFLSKKASGELPITHKNMTRFNISIEDGVKMVIHALENAWGGELYVPKIPSYRVVDVAKAVCSKCTLKEVGIRPGEKIHEEMISPADSYFTYEIDNYYVILPSNPQWNLEEFVKFHNAKKVVSDFHYNSGNNPDFLSVNQIAKLISKL